MRKLVECEHCQGRKQCSARGGKSCHECLLAAGRKPKDWTTVRCSFCGGRGRIAVEVEEEQPEETPGEAVEESADE